MHCETETFSGITVSASGDSWWSSGKKVLVLEVLSPQNSMFWELTVKGRVRGR